MLYFCGFLPNKSVSLVSQRPEMPKDYNSNSTEAVIAEEEKVQIIHGNC